MNGRHLDAFDDFGTVLARALGKCLGDVGGVALAVERQMHCAHHVGHIQMRIHLRDVFGGHFTDIDTKRAGQRGCAVDLFLAFLGQGHGDRTVLLHARGNAGLFLQLGVELGGILRQPCHVLTRAQLAHKASGMPGRAAGQLSAFQQNDIGPAQLGQVIGNRAAGHSAANDDGACLVRKIGHVPNP